MSTSWMQVVCIVKPSRRDATCVQDKSNLADDFKSRLENHFKCSNIWAHGFGLWKQRRLYSRLCAIKPILTRNFTPHMAVTQQQYAFPNAQSNGSQVSEWRRDRCSFDLMPLHFPYATDLKQLQSNKDHSSSQSKKLNPTQRETILGKLRVLWTTKNSCSTPPLHVL